jgi:hypothetical protein
VALLYKDRKQGQLFLKSKILQWSDNFAYNKKDGVTRVYSPDGNIVEYILCQCDMNSVMRRFCGMHLSNYTVTDPYQAYDGEPLLFVASRVR